MNVPLTDTQVTDAVHHLHGWLRVRTTAWNQLATELTELDGPERTQRLRELDAELREHLLPYMVLEEQLLGTTAPTVDLEHGAIRRAVTRLHHLATAGEVHASLAQTVVTNLSALVEDHLRHEREIYLPQLAAS